jgi:signal transduction histidine kinase
VNDETPPPVPSTPSATPGPDYDRRRGSRSVPAFSGRMWKQVLFLLLDLPLAIAGFVCSVTMITLGVGLAVTPLGLPLLAVAVAVCRALGRVERSRARSLLRLDIAEPSPSRRRGRSLRWMWSSLGDPVAWRSVLYALIRLPWGITAFVVTLVFIVVGWPLLPFVVRAGAAVDAAMIRALLSPSAATERRIAELEADRGAVVDSAAADARRIERDLHDGAQARLVNLAMGLGLAKETLAADPAAAARMVAEAHGEAKLVLRELRDLARGIQPAILTDRGLTGALDSLAATFPIPVAITIDLTDRPAPAVERIVYFTAAELLTNVTKHSGARSADVVLGRTAGRLEMRVTDDGRGGAAVTPGGGLAGLGERLAAVDGALTVDSPPGGPTTAYVYLPWRS